MASRMKDYQIARLAMLPTHGAHEAGRMAKGQRSVNCKPQATTLPGVRAYRRAAAVLYVRRHKKAQWPAQLFQ